MQLKKIALAALLGASFASTSYAIQPEAGEGPLFQNEIATGSAVERAEVAQQAISSPPAVNTGKEFNFGGKSALSRNEVREQTREALAHGFRIKSGEMS